MPDIVDQQTQAAALIKAQIEALENAAQTLPYWEVYRAILNQGGGGGDPIDISTLAKEVTSTEINEKLPDLSNGKIPVTIAPINLTADWQLLTTDITIPAGSCYVYLKVILGDVTINGLTFSTNEYLNLEPSHFARHPEIDIEIPAGKSVRLVRGY